MMLFIEDMSPEREGRGVKDHAGMAATEVWVM